MNPDGTPTLQPFTAEELAQRELEEAVFMGLGELASIFMQQNIIGTQMVMPTEEAQRIGRRMLAAFEKNKATTKDLERNESDLRTVS